jgi:hypothetical protein
MIRPGPPWIERNQAPGGLVIYVYALHLAPLTFTVELLLVRPLPDVDGTVAGAVDPHQATADGEFVAALIKAETPLVMVAYDGDTGERMTRPGMVI